MSQFDGINFASPEGQKIKRFIESRLIELRNQLESPTMSEKETQTARGAIQELKRLIRDPAVVVNTPAYSGPIRQFTAGRE